MTRFWRSLFEGGALALWLSVSACWPDVNSIDGSCVVLAQSELDCHVTGYDDELQDARLVGYSCNGSMRPDIDATMDDGVPEGVICADKDSLAGSDDRAYCCTEDLTPCAYNPMQDCEEGTVGYQCYGNNRPESLNPSLLCSNGTNENGLVHYCCSGRPEKSPCEQSSVAGCGDRLLGFLCEGDGLPRGEDLGANQSRADYYYPTCSIAKPAPNPAYNTYCCYMPLVIPVGGTCVNHPRVPDCEPGRFGFACYGPDNPEENYPPMKCPGPGIPGRSAEGYDATLYCCDFT